LAGDLNRLREFGEFRLGHAWQSDLTAPAINVIEVASSQTRQRYHAHIRLLAILAGDAERSRPHWARGNLIPARRPFVLKRGGGGARSVGMTGREGARLRLSLRRGLFLGHSILLDLAPVATGYDGGHQNEEGPSCAGRVPLGARQQVHLKYLQGFGFKRKLVVRGM
jgi:hypothetical protein